MFKEFLLAVKLCKYGLQFKLQVGLGIAFIVFGILFEFLYEGKSILGGFYLVLASMFIFQSIISMDVSTLIQSSALKKNLQVRFPYVAMVPIMLVIYTIMVGIHLFLSKGTDAETVSVQARVIIGLGFALGGTMIYLGLAYKYMVVGSIIFCLIMIPSVSIISMPISYFDQFITFNMPVCIVAGYAMVIVGSILSNIFMRLCYKKELSKWAFKQALDRAAK